MTVERAFLHILKQDSNVNTHLGDKIYPIVSPQNMQEQLPLAIFTRTSTERDQLLSERSLRVVSFFDLYIFSSQYDELAVISKHIVNALHFKKGNYANTQIDNIFCTDENDDGFDKEDGFFVRLQNYRIEYIESISA